MLASRSLVGNSCKWTQFFWHRTKQNVQLDNWNISQDCNDASETKI